MLYHQAGETFSVFDVGRNNDAGAMDGEMPSGIFMNPNAEYISVSGQIQMTLYASIRNPLVMQTRGKNCSMDKSAMKERKVHQWRVRSHSGRQEEGDVKQLIDGYFVASDGTEESQRRRGKPWKKGRDPYSHP